MNGSSTSTPSASREELLRHIDASCRPLLLPIIASLLWLVIGSVFALVTSVKLHSPTVLANSAWFSYGHTRVVAHHALAYGFASQAGLAVVLWILCRLGSTPLVGGGAVLLGSLFWNVGLAIGVVGVLNGHGTGFDWLEFPMAGCATMLTSYLVIAVCALLTFRARRQEQLYPSQWYILAALLSFPWLYVTARILLVANPVRGVMQTVVNSWFVSGLFNLWLGALGLSILFYFIPKIGKTSLHSATLAKLGFWLLVIFGGWATFYPGLPLPSWMLAIGTSATLILLVPTLAVVANLWFTLGAAKDGKVPVLGFFKNAVLFYAIATVLAVFSAKVPQLRLTLFGEGAELLFLYGFLGLALFGAIHYITPLLTGVPAKAGVSVTYLGILIGLVLAAGTFVIGGVLQQKKLVDGSVPFVEVMNGTKPFIRASTLGLLILLVANLAMLTRVLGQVWEACRQCCTCCCPESTAKAGKLKPARASR